MATLIIENTGVDYLYPDGVPIAEVSIEISEIFKLVARRSALASHIDDSISGKSVEQKEFSELHGEGDRITKDFLSDAAGDILPVFQSMQRWMGIDDTILPYEFDTAANPGLIIYRWQIMDTRLENQKYNYTSETLIDIRTDLTNVRNVLKYAKDALRDYVLKELYDAMDHPQKSKKYFKGYEQNRSYVAFWAKSDLSLQTQYRYAGV